MTSVIGALQVAAIAFAMFGVIACAISVVAARPFLRRVAALPPAVAATWIRRYLAAPWVAGAILTLASFSPSIVASAIGAAHHCAAHLGHPHLCLFHPPGDAGASAGWLLLAALVVLLVVRGRTPAAALIRARGVLAGLDLDHAPSHRGAVVIPSDEPACATIGWLRPALVVSRGFLRRTSDEHVEAALAHERAHARRRDAWWSFVASGSAIALPAATAAALLGALDLATERACDEEAAQTLGDRLVVADAILAGERLGVSRVAAGAAGFGGSIVDARVRALLAPPLEPVSLRPWGIGCALVVAAAFLCAAPLHHAAETVVGLVAH